jgi:hypothetical protein
MTTTVISVTAQPWQRAGRAIRWAYVIQGPGPGDLFVSEYRWHSQASALAAGRRDVDAHQQLLDTAAQHGPDELGNGWCRVEGIPLKADDCTYCWWVGDSIVSLLTKVAR